MVLNNVFSVPSDRSKNDQFDNHSAFSIESISQNRKQGNFYHWLEIAESLSLLSSLGSSVAAIIFQQLLPVLISVPLSLSLSQINRQRSLQTIRQAGSSTLSEIEQSLFGLQQKTDAIQIQLKVNSQDNHSISPSGLILTQLNHSLSELYSITEAMHLKLQDIKITTTDNSMSLAKVVPLVITPQPTPVCLRQSAKRGRVTVVIDGCNLDFSAARQKMAIDFAKLKDHLIKDSAVINGIYYYTGTHYGNQKEQAALAELQQLGYQIISKNIVQYADGSRKGNLDVEMAIDMMALAEQSDTIVLVSGDGDLAYVVNLLKQRQIRVEVFGFRNSTATKLVKVAHPFYRNLASLTKIFHPLPLKEELGGENHDQT